MEIRRISLENIKSYQSATVELRTGTTAISGHNGAGKSTLIEAIGVALFDYRPYAYNKFLREGEKTGSIAIEFLSSYDDRLYQSFRKISMTASPWHIYDPEMHSAVAQGKEDVTDFLRLHLGIDKNIDLVTLFCSAIAVPQGTFTADFLQQPSKRKQIFDPLLQVEEYRKAFDNLQPVIVEFRDQLTKVSQTILEKQNQNVELPQWQLAIQEKQLALLQVLQQTQALHDQREQTQALVVRLTEEKQQIDHIKSALMHAQTTWEHQEQVALQAEHEAIRTATAQGECQRAQPAHADYLQAEAALGPARAKEQHAQQLYQSITLQENHIANLNERRQTHGNALAAALAAKAEAQDLQPKAAEYQHMVELVQQARQAKRDIDQQQKRRKTANATRQELVQQIERMQTALLERDTIAQLAAQESQLSAQYERLRQQQLAVQTAQTQRPKLDKQAQSLQKHIQHIEQTLQETTAKSDQIRALGDVVAALQSAEREKNTLQQVMAELQAQLTISERSMYEAHGGMCPILREPCLNIAQKHVAGLDEYLGEQIAQLTDQITDTTKTLDAAEQQVVMCRENAAHAAEVPILEQRLTELRENLHLRRDELATVNNDLAELNQRIATTAAIAADIALCATNLENARTAQKRLAELSVYEQQVQRELSNFARIESELQEIDAVIAQQTPIATALTEREKHEKDLQRVAEKVQLLLVTAATEDQIRVDLEQTTSAILSAEQELLSLQEQVQHYVGAHEDVVRLDAILQATRTDHQTYLRNEGDAQRAGETADAAQRHRTLATQMRAEFLAQQTKYAAMAAAFNEEQLQLGQDELRRIEQDAVMIREQTVGLQKDIEHLNTLIDGVRKREAEIHMLSATKQEIERTQEYFTFCRTTIKEAGPRITKALLTRISAEANAIFTDIMGMRTLTLSWNEEYDIIIRSGSSERSFAQLSGGEQMTAALAVRLALLRALTNSRLAIFDEPTQNMDQERRLNLAEQIRRIRDFSQVIVISHDDTFEDGLDAVVRVEKHDGATRVTSGLRAFA